jgi:hypothetical protein
MRKRKIVKPVPYEDESVICDWCGEEGGEWYTPYDLGGAEYPYEKGLDLHDKCKTYFVSRYGPQIWKAMDAAIDDLFHHQIAGD